jgi:DNA gyrase subunit A
MRNPEATLDDLMAFVPGPDLPTGGIVVGLDGIREAYETGKGTFRTRARTTIEQVSARRAGIIVTELPYLIGPERVIERIKDGVNKKKITGISNVIDLTDRKHGLRLVIEVKTGFSPEAVLDQLYRLTPLEDGFSINNVALVEGRPVTLGLKEMLRVYIDHRVDVVTRRSQFRLARRTERLHLVEGLLRAIVDIDEVIQVIRASDDAESARSKLQTVFDLSELQADYILELRLRRLTKFSRIELETERDSLVAEIESLSTLLGSRETLLTLVSDELSDVSAKFGTPRRTTLLGEDEAPAVGAIASLGLEVEDTPCTVILTATGRLLRSDRTAEFAATAKRVKQDVVRAAVRTTTRGELGAITDRGRLVRFSPIALPAVSGDSVSFAAATKSHDYIVGLQPGENVVSIINVSSESIALGTANGVIKRVDVSTFPAKSDFSVINLDDNDRVVGVAEVRESDDAVFVTAETQVLHFPIASVRAQGVGAAGVAGINLSSSDRVIHFTVASVDDSTVVTVTAAESTLTGADPGRAKLTPLADFPPKGRATGGVRGHGLLKGEVGLALAWVGPEPRACASDGTPRLLPTDTGKRDGTGTPLAEAVTILGTRLV